MNVSRKKVHRPQIAKTERRSPVIVEKLSAPKYVQESNFRSLERQSSSLAYRYGRTEITPSSHELSSQQQKEISTTKKSFSNRITAYAPTQIRTEFPSNPMPEQYPFSIRHITVKQKIFLFITFLVIVVVCCAVILPSVLILRQRINSMSSSFTNISASMCSRSTCIGQETPYHSSMTTLSYGFDGNLYDSTGLASGTGQGAPPSTSFTSIAMSGQTYYLSSVNSQYMTIPYVNLSQQSFTLQIWAVPNTNNYIDMGLFSQCGSVDNICFSLSIRNYHVTLSFDSQNANNMPLIGSAMIPFSLWSHITIVYNAIALQQLIYVNGHIDAISTGMVKPYQGTPVGITTTTVGFSSSYNYSSSYFNGYLDQLTISSGSARSACQVLNDATLIIYFPFDTTDQLLDHSSYNYYGYASNTVTFSSGHIQQALLFNLSTSYFQSECFPTTRTSSMPFSISLWIYPLSVTGGGTIVHLSLLQNGTGVPCYDLLALTPTGQIVMQLIYSSTNVTDFQGPVISNNTWTHLALVYGYPNGLRLFVNGIVTVVSQPYAYIPVYTYNTIFVTLANTNPKGPAYSVNCPSGSSSGLISGPFYGALDDFRLYTRELDPQEICVLSNM